MQTVRPRRYLHKTLKSENNSLPRLELGLHQGWCSCNNPTRLASQTCSRLQKLTNPQGNSNYPSTTVKQLRTIPRGSNSVSVCVCARVHMIVFVSVGVCVHVRVQRHTCTHARIHAHAFFSDLLPQRHAVIWTAKHAHAHKHIKRTYGIRCMHTWHLVGVSVAARFFPGSPKHLTFLEAKRVKEEVRVVISTFTDHTSHSRRGVDLAELALLRKALTPFEFAPFICL